AIAEFSDVALPHASRARCGALGRDPHAAEHAQRLAISDAVKRNLASALLIFGRSASYARSTNPASTVDKRILQNALPTAQTRIQQIPEGVAQHVERQDDDTDRQAREDGEIRRGLQIAPAFATQHAAPGRSRRWRAEAEEAQRRFD